MVLTPAPNSRRPDVKTPHGLQFRDNWTLRFRKASASRLKRRISFWTFASCAVLLPSSLSLHSQADPSGSNLPDLPAQTSPSASAFQAQTESSQPSMLSGSSSSALPASLSSSQPLSQPVPPLEVASAPSDMQFVARPETSSQNLASRSVPVAAKALSPQEIASKTAPLPEKMRFRVFDGGQERHLETAVKPQLTVGQALAAMGISLAVLDRVVPSAAALARDGLTIRLTRISTQVQKRRTAIPAEVRYQPTTKIEAGAKQTVQEARAGAFEITERVWIRNGHETKREFVSKRLALAPQHKIIALGVKSHLMPGVMPYHRRYASALSFRGGTPRDRMLPPANPNTFAPVKVLSVLATGYSAGRAGGAIGNWTATGVRCTYGAVAVDPRLIPLGSKLYVEGYGYGFACDTGGAIKGRHIDLAFDSPRAAFRHGKKQVKVWILGR